MPFGDRTGPRGEGSMTRRGLGYCSGSDRPGYSNSWPRGGFGRGFGRGFRSDRGSGFGRGRGNRYYRRGFPRWYRGEPSTSSVGYGNSEPQVSKENEVKVLKEEEKTIEDNLNSLKGELDKIRERISELEGE